MKTSLKFILAETVLAVVSVAVLASPVGAQVRVEPWIPVSTNNAFWGLALGPVIPESVGPAYGYIGRAYGSVGPVPPGAPVPAPAYEVMPRILDCVHITFPQCAGGGM